MTLFGLPTGGDVLDGDRYVTWDAAYVLGSLTSAERREYEGHLETCDRCRSAVADISGIPALLAMLSPDEVRALDEQPEPPPLRPEVLDNVLTKVRWRRRRTRWLTTAAVGVAAAVVAVGTVVALRPEIMGWEHASQQQASGPTMEMTKMAPTPFSATVSLTAFTWGTRIDMACTYGNWTSGDGGVPPSNLGLVVVGRDGTRTQVATWLGLSGATALPSGNTAMPMDQIAAVQLVAADSGQVLLQKSL
jgi:hypothetical protein